VIVQDFVDVPAASFSLGFFAWHFENAIDFALS
jgi:hypothetical protein